MALVTKPFGDIITFTRASTATYFNSSGVLTSAAINAPRFDYDPVTLEFRGLLMEGSRTNRALQSQDMYGAGTGSGTWVWTAGTVANNTQVAPDGTTTAETLTTTGAAESIYQSITVVAATTYTFSVFVKLGTMAAADFRLAFYDNTAGAFIASQITPTQVPNSTGWTRVTYTLTTPAGCTSMRVYPFRNSDTLASCTVHLWGAQLEAGAFVSSYIPTTAALVTRSIDAAKVSTLAPWYNGGEGTLYAEFVLPLLGGTAYRSPAALGAMASTNLGQTITVNDGGGDAIQLNIYNDALVYQGADGPFPTATAGTVLKTAGAFTTNSAALSVNGSEPTTDTSIAMAAGVEGVALGATFNGANNPLFGYLRRVRYFPTRLPNEQLQALTA